MKTPKRSVEEKKKYPSHKELDMEKYRRIIEAGSFDNMFNYGFDIGIQAERQRCEDMVEEVNRSWREDPMTVEHHAEIIAEAVEAERERILRKIRPLCSEYSKPWNSEDKIVARVAKTFIKVIEDSYPTQ